MAVWYNVPAPASSQYQIEDCELQASIYYFHNRYSIDNWHEWNQYRIVRWQFGRQMHEVLNVYIGIETKFGDYI